MKPHIKICDKWNENAEMKGREELMQILADNKHIRVTDSQNKISDYISCLSKTDYISCLSKPTTQYKDPEINSLS